MFGVAERGTRGEGDGLGVAVGMKRGDRILDIFSKWSKQNCFHDGYGSEREELRMTRIFLA